MPTRALVLGVLRNVDPSGAAAAVDAKLAARCELTLRRMFAGQRPGLRAARHAPTCARSSCCSWVSGF
jgi:hypothetical protein